MNWSVCPLWGRRGWVLNLESILLNSPVADLSDLVSLQNAGMQVYNSFSGCRNDRALLGEGGGRDTHSSALGFQTQQLPQIFSCKLCRAATISGLFVCCNSFSEIQLYLYISVGFNLARVT
jgi:hypothetical protein